MEGEIGVVKRERGTCNAAAQTTLEPAQVSTGTVPRYFLLKPQEQCKRRLCKYLAADYSEMWASLQGTPQRHK